MEKFHCCV